MAVKAADQITMTDMTDVKSFCRYYLLQSSTLAAPSKPTTNPPSSSWTKTEPSYTAGSTKSLYFTDLTVYSNNTFSYSDVSLSSSYEAAKTAYNKAVAAAKTATNYIDYTSANGLQVGNKTNGSWNGFRTQITSSAFNILNAAGEALASYGAKLVELGKNATDAVINMCNGKAKLYVGKDVEEDTEDSFIIESDYIVLKGHSEGEDTEATKNAGSVSSFTDTPTFHTEARFQALTVVDTVSEIPEGVYADATMHAYCQSENAEEAINASIRVYADEAGSGLYADADEIWFTSNGNTVEIRNGRIVLANGCGLQSLDSEGVARALIWLGTTNNIQIGNASKDTAHSGDTYVNAINGAVRLRGKSSTVELIPYSDANVNSFFRPTVTNVVGLGSTNYKWYRLYQYADTVSTSDEREKHDIAEIKDGDVLEMLFDKLIPKTYQLNGEKEDKTHIGFIAQDVSKSLEEIGLHESDFGLINHEYWTDKETGEEKDEYGLAYSEFIALNTHMIQKLRKENEELKERLAKIEEKLGVTN